MNPIDSAATRMTVEPVLIRNGAVYDGTGGPLQHVDLRISDGLIQEIGPHLQSQGERVINAAGLIVAPGLVDLHVHVHTGMGIYAVDPVDAGLRTGVTTMLDTGTAGALTYANLARLVMPAAAEDVYALLNISMIGAIQGHPDIPPYMGDLNDRRHAHVPSAVECVQRFPERIVGMKVRLTHGLANFDLQNEQAGFDAVFEAAEQLRLPLMIHHVASKLPTAAVLDRMRSGDIYTHLYHPHPDHGFADNGAPLACMLAARERGVVMDVGHGVGAFVWKVAEPACKHHGFWPDTISTDLHQFNLHGPVIDLPTTMSKFLHLGMPLEKIIQATTSSPAKAMRLAHACGQLQTGRAADIVLLKQEQGSFPLVDVAGETRIANERLVAVSVCKRGRWTDCGKA